MITFNNIPLLRKQLHDWRKSDARIAFVPTMGNLHAGHLALVQKAKKVADRVIVSIFVNPLQFGPTEDFARYPRTHAADIEKLITEKVDALFLPETEALYPNEQMPITRVSVPGLSDDLCGVTRPNLFYGVTTVVAKLFNIVQPDIAVFGKKDFQQAVIIRQMVKDLNFPIEIITIPTTREPDRLAMSSRNQYLTPEERALAPKLYESLHLIQQAIQEGNVNYTALCEEAKQQLEQLGFKVDYIEVRNQETLRSPVPGSQENLVILGAAFLGKTRLIDNVVINCHGL